MEQTKRERLEVQGWKVGSAAELLELEPEELALIETRLAMTYKGYSAKIEYRSEDSCFIGHIAGITDVVGFHGESVVELRSAFEEAVDDYLETCERLNRPPQKPYSGKLMLRLPPEIHAAVATAAQVSGKSLNQWAVEKLATAVQQ